MKDPGGKDEPDLKNHEAPVPDAGTSRKARQTASRPGNPPQGASGQGSGDSSHRPSTQESRQTRNPGTRQIVRAPLRSGPRQSFRSKASTSGPASASTPWSILPLIAGTVLLATILLLLGLWILRAPREGGTPMQPLGASLFSPRLPEQPRQEPPAPENSRLPPSAVSPGTSSPPPFPGPSATTVSPGTPASGAEPPKPEASLHPVPGTGIPEPGPSVPARSPVQPVRKVAPPGTERIVIATWNLRDCALLDQKTGKETTLHDKIARIIAESRVDIIAVQEIQSDKDRGGDMTSLSFALAKAAWPMPYTAVLDTAGSDDLAVFSRHPIVTRSVILDPGSARPWPRPALAVTIQLKDRVLTLVNLHLKAMSDALSFSRRKAQSQALAEWLRTRFTPEGIRRNLIVLAGDMNTVSAGDRSSPGKDSQKPPYPTTLSILQLRENDTPEDDLFAVNEYLAPGLSTYEKGSHRGILDHLILSEKAMDLYVPDSVRTLSSHPELDLSGLSDHRLLLLELALPE